MIWGASFSIQNLKIFRLKSTFFKGGSLCRTGFSDLAYFAINRWTVQRTATAYQKKNTLFRRIEPLTVKKKFNHKTSPYNI
jgi:hypothetical protein